MKKTAASVLLLLIAWFSWPLWTALTIREAVLTGDTAVLERKIDWPGVRASLKQSLPVYLAGQGVIGQTLTALFGTTVVDTIVDSYVSPSGLVQLMARPEQRENLATRNLRWAFFKSPLCFETIMRPPKYPDTRVINQYELRQYELRGFEWKLIGVRIVTPSP